MKKSVCLGSYKAPIIWAKDFDWFGQQRLSVLVSAHVTGIPVPIDKEGERRGEVAPSRGVGSWPSLSMAAL